MTDDEQRTSPWLSMWVSPRATIQEIIERNPRRSVLLLASLSGISQALDKASIKNAGDTFPPSGVLLISITGGIISGIIVLYIGGWLLKHTGHWLGGEANSENVRAAIAWSAVPTAWGLLIWIPELMIFDKDLFTSAAESVIAHSTLYFSFLVVELVIAIWATVIFFKSLGQVHGFSAWRSLGATLIALCLVMAPLLLVVFVAGAFT